MIRKVQKMKEEGGGGKAQTETLTLDESIKRWTYTLVKAGHPIDKIGKLTIDWIRMLEEERTRRMREHTKAADAHLAQFKGNHFLSYVIDLTHDG